MRPHYFCCLPIVVALFTGIVCPPLRGQVPTDIDKLADRTAARVADAHPKLVQLAMGTGCALRTQLCETLSSSLSDSLTKLIPAIQFASPEDVIQDLKKHGFLSIDVYEDFAEENAASDLGADILLILNMTWNEKYYELSSKIFEVSASRDGETFTTKIARTPDDNEKKPLLVKDAETGVSIIVLRGDSRRFRPFKYPTCASCPDPRYTPEARRKGLEGKILFLVTVSDQGTAQQIVLLRSFDAGLSENAVKAIQGWRFTPAIGLDVKPFAVRVPVEVTFQLGP